MPAKQSKVHQQNPLLRNHRHHRSKRGSQRSLHDGRERRIQLRIKQEELTIKEYNDLLYENLSEMSKKEA